MTGGTKCWRFAWLIIALFTVVGCTTWSERSGLELERQAGLLERNDGQWALQPCDGGQPMVVIDDGALATLFDRVAQPGQQAIFVDLEGAVRADWSMTPERILRMQSTGTGCASEAGAGEHWVAQGLNRDWRVVIDRQGMAFTDEQNQSVGPVAMIAEQLPDDAISFRAEQDAALELWLYAQDCFDYANDYHHLSATLVVNGRRLNGCAYQGTRAP